MKMRSTKGALLMSALSLFLCFTMLMGTTFAWFTDSAASNGNIITAGTLDVEMYWADGTEAVPTTDSGWTDASTGAIFKYTLWEPGYAEVRHIKIANEGNLALKYKVLIQANGTVSDLSDVIDVYYADPAVQVADASALTADNKLGTLTDVLANLGLTGNGTLEAGKSDVITLALKMQEGAGNEYMGQSIGTDFSIILVATQLASEEDSFDNQYDAPAVYPTITTVTVPASGTEVSLSNEGVKLTVPAAATTEGDVFEIAVSNNNVTTDTATGETTVSFDLSLYKNSEPIAAGDTIYEIEMLVGNVYPTSVTHNGNELTKADTGADQTYKLEDGVLTIYTKSFSPFTFSYITGQLIADKAGEQAYALTIDELRTAVNAGKDFAGWTITMMEDIDLAGAEFAPIGYAVDSNGTLDGAAPFSGMFDGNGHTIANFVTVGVAEKNCRLGLFGFIYAKDGFTAGVKNLTISNAMFNNADAVVGIIAVLATSDGASPLEFSGLDISGTINAFGDVGQAGIATLMYGNEVLVKDIVVDVDFVIPAEFTASYYKFISPCFGQLHMLENGHITIENVDYSGCSIYYPSTFRLEDRSTVIAGYNSIWVYNTPAGTRVLGCGSYAGQFYDDGITVTIDGVDYTHADLLKGQKDFPGYMYDYIIRPDAFILYTYVTTAEELVAAVKAGGNVMLGADIAMTGSVAVSNANFVLDGCGHTITMAEGATNPIALFDITGGKATFKNVTFDGIAGGAVVRTVDVDFTAENVTAQNGNHTQQQGLFRLLGKSTLIGCVFKNNVCKMVVTLNYDANSSDQYQTIKDCVFEGNTCNDTAVVHYVYGSGFLFDGNKLIHNTVYSTGNAASVYLGFKTNCIVTNNVFDGNTVYGGSGRCTGGLMVGNAAVITGNAFVNNAVIVEGREGLGNDVCASAYYADIDLSGNYWGGGAPVEGDDYHLEYRNYKVIINDYLTTYAD